VGARYTLDAKELFDLKGKAAIVTGAARGIGRAIAQGLASAGVFVVMADVLDALRETEQVIVGRGHKCTAVKVDLGNQEGRVALVQRALGSAGHIDILVNCAGVTTGAASQDYPQKEWERTLNVNLTSIFQLSQLVAKDMISRRSGVIINIASIGAVQGFPNNPAYLASKGGLLQLSRALATDWAKYNIRVNNICPGYIHTPMTGKSFSNPTTHAARAARTMLNRWGEPEELIGPVIFLASEAASYITGNDLFVDGGWAKCGLTEAL
jgi:NAD(P)-dependent dehydrogenase (short-subunit alcohol dehydrogenase family)